MIQVVITPSNGKAISNLDLNEQQAQAGIAELKQICREYQLYMLNCDTLGYDDLIVLKTIASFVESGSYIEMLGSGGEKWRWLFKNGDCMEEKALILYPSDPMYVVTCDWVHRL